MKQWGLCEAQAGGGEKIRNLEKTDEIRKRNHNLAQKWGNGINAVLGGERTWLLAGVALESFK